MKSSMELALVQIRRGSHPEENAARAARLVREAQGTDLVLLPENWLGPFPVGLRVRLDQARIAEIRQRWPYLGDVSRAAGQSKSSAQSSEAAAKEKGKRRR